MKKIISIILFIIIFVCFDRGLSCGINEGLNRYFGLDKNPTVLFIGHSHLMLAINKTEFEHKSGVTVSKYCREGVNIADRYIMLKHFLSLPNKDSLKVVIYGVDQFMFTGKGLSQNSYKLFYPFIGNSDIDAYIKESSDSYDYYLHKLICTTRYSDALLNSSIRGWIGNWNNYKIGNLDVNDLQEQIKRGKQRHIDFEQNLIEDFENTLELLKKKGIVTILVNTPIAKILNEYEPEAYMKFNEYIQSKTDSTFVYYWDLNPEYADKYELLFDPIHLNVEGQKVINNVLADKFTLFLENHDFSYHSLVQ